MSKAIKVMHEHAYIPCWARLHARIYVWVVCACWAVIPGDVFILPIHALILLCGGKNSFSLKAMKGGKSRKQNKCAGTYGGKFRKGGTARNLGNEEKTVKKKSG